MNTKKDWATAMTAEDFRSLIQSAFGKGGQSRFARFAGISRSQVNRYANGGKIPRHVAVILLLALAARDAGYSLCLFAPRHGTDASAAKRKRQIEERAGETAI